MTSSSLAYIDEVDTSDVVLNEGAIVGLTEVQRDHMKANVVLANEAWKTAGNSIRACASNLHEIKKNLIGPKGKRNWTALIESGDLNFTKSVAQDLLAAHIWLSNSSIPDRFLTNVSARTLGTIAREKDDILKQKITEAIIASDGTGFSEIELRKLKNELKPKKKKAKGTLENRSIADLIKELSSRVEKGGSSTLKSLATKVSELNSQNAELRRENLALRKKLGVIA